MSGYLKLRTLASPYGDITVGSVLSKQDVDNNFIYLKGLDIITGSTTLTNLILTKRDGSTLSVNLNNIIPPTPTSYWTSGSSGTESIRTINGTGLDATGDYAMAQGVLTFAYGNAAHAEGFNTKASGNSAHAEGVSTTTVGDASHAEGGNTTASGNVTHAEGNYTTAIGINSHSEGNTTTAIGESAHAEGFDSKAIGVGSHSEGVLTSAIGEYGHAEGDNTFASGNQSHAEGRETNASGDWSHAEGNGTITEGGSSHTEGCHTTAIGNCSHAEGETTTAIGASSHSEGMNTIAATYYAHAEGASTLASGSNSHAEGAGSTTIGSDSHAEGVFTIARGGGSHTEGYKSTAIGHNSHAEGGDEVNDFSGGTAIGIGSHAEGLFSTAIGDNSHAEGVYTTATTYCAHAEGDSTLAYGDSSHSEGMNTIASGYGAHAEGDTTTAIGDNSHAEGIFTITTLLGAGAHAEGEMTIASGCSSHVEGSLTTTIGYGSHAEGNETTAIGDFSHAEGLFSTAIGDYSHTTGQYNITNGNYSQILGGSGNTTTTAATGSAIIGGSGITATLPYTTYVSKLNIQSIPSGTLANNVGIDSSGNVIIGTTGSTDTNTFTTASTLTNKTAYFNRNDSLSAYSLNLSTLAYDSDLTAHTTDSSIHHTLVDLDSRYVNVTGDTISGSLTIEGNLVVNGSAITANSETVLISDNLLVLNYLSGSTDISGVTRGYAGIEVDRGAWDPYWFIFQESDDTFRVGITGQTQAVATREDNPIANGVAFWNNNEYRFDTHTGLTFDTGTTTLNLIGSISADTYYGDGSNLSGLPNYWTSGSSGSYSIKANNDSGLDSSGNYAVAEGYGTTASGESSHAEGQYTIAAGTSSHAEGDNTTANLVNVTYTSTSNIVSACTIDSTYEFIPVPMLSGNHQTEWSNYIITAGGALDLELNGPDGPEIYTIVFADTDGSNTYLIDDGWTGTTYTSHTSLSRGVIVTTIIAEISGSGSHAEGSYTIAVGNYSHAEGNGTTTIGNYGHAEGDTTTAIGNNGAHSEGYSTIASGESSHSEGRLATAIGIYSHAEGSATVAFGVASHAEGAYTSANTYSHSEGYTTLANGESSHAGGYQSVASGTTSFIHSTNSVAGGIRSAVIGGQNITGTTDDTVYVPFLNLANTPTASTTYDVMTRETNGNITNRNLGFISAQTYTYYVDIERTDTYIELGTFQYPYKTIASAITAVNTISPTTVRNTIKILSHDVTATTTNIIITGTSIEYLTIEGNNNAMATFFSSLVVSGNTVLKDFVIKNIYFVSTVTIIGVNANLTRVYMSDVLVIGAALFKCLYYFYTNGDSAYNAALTISNVHRSYMYRGRGIYSTLVVESNSLVDKPSSFVATRFYAYNTHIFGGTSFNQLSGATASYFYSLNSIITGLSVPSGATANVYNSTNLGTTTVDNSGILNNYGSVYTGAATVGTGATWTNYMLTNHIKNDSNLSGVTLMDALNNLDVRFVNVSGDTMTGNLIVPSVSATSMSAVTVYGNNILSGGTNLLNIFALSGSDTNTFTTASTLYDKMIYFDRTNALSAYSANLSTLAYNDDLTGHTTNTGNPHQVTASQVGSYSASEVDDNFVYKSGDTMSGALIVSSVSSTTMSADTLFAHAISGMTPITINSITINDVGGISGKTFYANGVDVMPYKRYVAVMSQSSTGDPTVTMIDNNIGEIIWTRFDRGDYRGTLASAFTTDKTHIMVLPGNSGYPSLISAWVQTTDVVIIAAYSGFSPIDVVDGTLSTSPIEIRVYN